MEVFTFDHLHPMPSFPPVVFHSENHKSDLFSYEFMKYKIYNTVLVPVTEHSDPVFVYI